MRVRINYAVDWEELPDEVHRLMKRASSYAESIKTDVTNTEIDIQQAGLRPAQIDTILNIRDEMVKLDAYLADVAQMIIGHQHIRLQQSADRGDLRPLQDSDEEYHEHGGEHGYEEVLRKTKDISEALSEFEHEDG